MPQAAMNVTPMTWPPMPLAEWRRHAPAIWIAGLLSWATVAPASAQSDTTVAPPRQATAAALNFASDSYTSWLPPLQFRDLLAQQTATGCYPTAIEGRNVDGLVSYRATFGRQPAEKYFQFQAYHGMAAEEYERTASVLEGGCYREIHTHSFVDPQGDERRCGVWTITFPMLVRTLATSQEDVERVRIVNTLQKLGNDDAEVQGVLLRTLKRCESQQVRGAAATNLRHIFVEPARSAAALVDALEADASEQVRQAAVSSLGYFPDQAAQSVPLLINELTSEQQAMRSAAARALANIYRKVGILDYLQVDRADPQQAVALLTRILATQAPPQIPGNRQEVQPVPVPNLADEGAVRIVILARQNGRRNDSTEYLRAGVIQDLARLGAAATSASPRVLEALKTDPSARVRSAAATALPKIARHRPDTISALTESMENDQSCRVSCVQALKEVGPSAKRCIPAVLRILESNGSRTLRGELIELLAIVGVESPAVAAKLLDIYQTDAKLPMRARAAIALAQVAPSVTVDGRGPVEDCFRQAKLQLDEPEQFAKAEAARAMGILGPQAQAAVPELIEATTHFSFSVQSAAVTSLSQIGPAARPAVPAIAALLQEDNWRLIPPVAAEALGNMGPLATEAIPALQACLEAPHPGLREAAAEALRKIGDGT